MMPGPNSSLSQRAFTRARDCLIEGWNCSQSVLLAMQEVLDIPDSGALKAATGFGGGIGNVGSLCGALAGATMTLGLLYGRSQLSQSDEKERTYLVCSKYYDRFVKVMGGCHCLDILKVDLRDPANRRKYWENKQNRERCASQTVGTAARLLMELIAEMGTRPGGTKTEASRGERGSEVS